MNQTDNYMDKVNSLENIENIQNIRCNPIVETFISCAKPFLPGIGELIDSSLTQILEEHQKKKRDEFCEYILNAPELITKDKLTNISFLMEFAKTIDVINKLARNEKIIFIASLFKNTFITNEISDIDEYEEWLYCLDTMSYRELEILIYLYNCELEYYGEEFDPKRKIIEYQKVVEVWFQFVKKVKRVFDIDEEDIESIVLGLSKTGFIKQEDIDVREATMKVYYVSNYFVRFMKRIKNDDK